MENENGGIDPTLLDDKSFDVSLLEKLQNDPSSLTPDEATAISKNAKAQFAQKKHWKDKAIDPETGKPWKDLVSSKPHVPTPPPANDELDAVKSSLGKLEQIEQKRQFGYSHKLDPEEADQVFAFAQGMGISPKDALEKPFLKAALEAGRAQKRAEGAIPGASHRSPTVEGKSWNEMKPDDRRKNFSKVAEHFKK